MNCSGKHCWTNHPCVASGYCLGLQSKGLSVFLFSTTRRKESPAAATVQLQTSLGPSVPTPALRQLATMNCVISASLFQLTRIEPVQKHHHN